MRWLIRVAAMLVALYLGASVLIFPRMALSVPSNPTSVSPADVGLSFENVELLSDGLALEGWWIPVSAPRAVMVFSHGAGANRHSTFFDSLAFYRAMHDQQIAILTFDHRNHGNSEHDTGALALGQREWRDIASAVEWLERHQRRSVPLLIAGTSMGGASAIHAAFNGVEADALILFDPALSNQDVLIHGGEVSYGIPAVFFYPFARATIAFNGIADDSKDALALGKRLRLPVLIVQDPADPITRAQFAKELAAANPKVEYAEAPATGPQDSCIQSKARWSTHVAAFPCHPDWTLNTLRTFLERQQLVRYGELTALP